ncbi:MAG TPA: dihydroxyacetone kinase subunit DhaK [Casimicrobiaceae bacterium]|jgi:dihydroxyacetone kinase-like protein|nr:dihydroxyacetone kinase subunit DhaK [Casimicrobiaceae bacterium]
MTKLMNKPDEYVDESLDGMCAAFDGYRRAGRGGRVVTRAEAMPRGRVGVATGGGFGHLPLFAGYVGDGMLDACAVGNVFAGPPVDVCTDALRAADGGAGVVCVLGNYGGDRMSFGEACDDFADAGGTTATVIVADDVASAPRAEAAKRRGVAGMVFAFKAAGASAARGDALDTVAAFARRTAERTRSIGVALAPCTIPGASAPGFSVAAGRIELGMGIHGEPGIEAMPLATADTVADAMLDRLLADGAAGDRGRVAVLVNSLGATPLEELLILYRHVARRLAARQVTVARRYVGHYATSMEMAGCSISLLDLDAELEALLAAPARCAFWR